MPDAAPAPPDRRDELLLQLLLSGWSRRLRDAPQDAAPEGWDARPLRIPRAAGGSLDALYFPVPDPRGLVLLGHPGIPPAKGYFHRGDRIPFLRARGFSALTFDHGGMGRSDAARGLFHREWLDVLAWARHAHADVPLSIWGVSLGGYFAHHALAADAHGVEIAIFEQVAPNLFRYAGARSPDLVARLLAPRGMRWFPCEAHAGHVRAKRVLYVSGGRDHGIAPEEAARLARARPDAAHHVVEDAPHLGAWKFGGEALRARVAWALDGA